MSFIWTRPKNLSFPLSYLKFSAKDSDGLTLKEYRIEDLKRNRFEEVLEIMKEKHLVDEPMYSSKGILSDPVSYREMIENWKKMLDQNISLVCFKDGSDEIVAVNILGVITVEESAATLRVIL